MQLIPPSKRSMAWAYSPETGKSKMSRSWLLSGRSGCATRWAWRSNKMASSASTTLVCSLSETMREIDCQMNCNSYFSLLRLQPFTSSVRMMQAYCEENDGLEEFVRDSCLGFHA